MLHGVTFLPLAIFSFSSFAPVVFSYSMVRSLAILAGVASAAKPEFTLWFGNK